MYEKAQTKIRVTQSVHLKIKFSEVLKIDLLESETTIRSFRSS